MAGLFALQVAIAGALTWGAEARRMPRASGLQQPAREELLPPSSPQPASQAGSAQVGASLLEAREQSEFPTQWALPFLGSGALRHQRKPQAQRQQAFPQAESIASFGDGFPRQSGLPLWAVAPPSEGGGGDGGGSSAGGEQQEGSEEYDGPKAIQDPVVMTVSATRKSGKIGMLPLPADWAGLIQRGTVTEVDGHFWKSQKVQVFIASLENDPERKVAIKIAANDNPALAREADLMERLKMLETLGVQDFGNVVAFYESSNFLGFRAVIEETIEDDLDMLLHDFKRTLPKNQRKRLFGWVRRLVPPLRRPVMPLRKSIPIIIDLLRGALALEHAGLIHQDLTPSSVLLTKDGRAVITDLSGACLEHCDLHDSLACGSPLEVPVGNRSLESVLYQPPELTRGVELSHAAHTWSIGLIFARMCFGYKPTFLAVLKRCLLEGQQFEAKRPSNQAIVDMIQSSFAIRRDPAFKRQATEVQSILKAMLDSNHTRRISTEDALLRFEEFAKQLGIKVPGNRVHPRMSLRWPVPPALEEEMERIGRIDEHSQGIAPEGPLGSFGASASGARDTSDADEVGAWQ